MQPVDAADGNYIHSYTDVAVPARGVPLEVSRTYNSLDVDLSAGLGPGWSWNWSAALDVTDLPGVVVWREASGARTRFVSDGVGGWVGQF